MDHGTMKSKKEKLARRYWKLLSWVVGVNSTTDAISTPFEEASMAQKAVCRTLADIAIDELKTPLKCDFCGKEVDHIRCYECRHAE